jgi:hypothetical protein
MAAEIVKAVRIILASGTCRLPAYGRQHSTLSCGRNLFQRAVVLDQRAIAAFDTGPLLSKPFRRVPQDPNAPGATQRRAPKQPNRLGVFLLQREPAEINLNN